MRFLFYSHDGLGLGHTRRHLAVAAALTELAPDAAVLVATGADDVERIGLPPRIEILKLPGLRKVANNEYVSRRLRIAVSDIRALRADLLEATVKSFQPSVVLVDKHPFGASGEFRAGLETLRAQGGRAALGLRDILDEPARVLQEWRPYKMQKRIAEFYDAVLIYGHRAVFDPITAYKFPTAVARRTRFCGYVVNRESGEMLGDSNMPMLLRGGDDRPIVLATAGGGEDGFYLLETFIRAAMGATWHGLVVAGPMTPEHELGTLRHLAAESGVTLHSFVSRLSSWFWSVNALVCMGGYNTLAEAVSKGVPTVCVPRVAPRSEQLLRARAFERLGLLSKIRPDQLNARKLREHISAALSLSREGLLAKAQAALAFDGARQAAGHLLALAAGARSGATLPEAKVAS
jgi:predicted glycosyltransferase